MIIAAVVLGIIVGSLPGVVGRGGSIFAAIMVVAGIRMLFRQRVGDGPVPFRMGSGLAQMPAARHRHGRSRRVPPGLLGVGGGFLIVAALTLALPWG